jgi:SNF2 family DNA or RNA helicase
MELLDNIHSLLGDNLKKSLKPNSKLKIAASCFSIYAYEALKDELEKIDNLEFIFTAPAFIPDELTDKVTKERREFHIPKLDREKSLYGTDFEIQLRNQLNQRAIAKECANWLLKKTTFKSNKSKSPMQQFAFLQSDAEKTVYMPLQGFTAVDLGYQQGDAVSNLVNKIEETDFTNTYLRLFEEIWSDENKVVDVTNEIHEHIASVYQENSPERIYFLILYNIFQEFLEELNEDVLPNDKTGYQESLIWNKLFNFQKDAATGIINKLETFNGCILADSVGLGKTFTALAVIKYYELRNKSVLVLSPKKIADNWLMYSRNVKTNIFIKDRFNYDVLAHTDLSRTSGESFGTPLNMVNWGNYDLVVIDESHNFRNNEIYKEKETRYQSLMNKVIRSGVKTKVLMLSATPVNNRFNDLKNQLALAYEGDSKILSDKLDTSRSVEDIFRNAQQAFNQWAKLPPEKRTAQSILDSLDFDFFKLLDSVTIARSRKHLQTFYDTKDIGDFPKRLKPLSFRCQLTDQKEVMSFDNIIQHLSLLKLSVYAPISYILPSCLKKYEDLYDTEIEGGKSKLRQLDREKSLQALMTTNLLKRLESSVHAFRLTLNRLSEKHKQTLLKIEEFENAINTAEINLNNYSDINTDTHDDIDLDEEYEIGSKIKINLADMDLPSWVHALKSDLKIINTLIVSMESITPEHDAKLQHLKLQIKDKIKNPINPANKKVLIFSAFADTANYLYQNLSSDMLHDCGVHSALITGGDQPKSTQKKSYAFDELLILFSPISKEKELIFPEEPNEIDILVATDCISEGQNLQDCDYLINYDIHWNPVRIIQRFGRIDRIGSKNECIQLANYWPDISLDDYINLKERVESRMMIVDVTATGDDNVLSSKSNDVAYRTEQLRKLQEDVIEIEDLKTGISITDLGLNDFRMDLLRYSKQNESLAATPNGLHAVISSKPNQGLFPGVIFALKNRHHGLSINHVNRLHPYYIVYVDMNGKVVADHTEAKPLLDLIRLNARGITQPILDATKKFNIDTDDGKNMNIYSELLSSAILSMIEIKEENDLDSLFTPGKTSALLDDIDGIDSFELVAFIVVQDM